ncbi:GNAT family N-acetyltransferase [Oceanicola sp. D3]|uniref:GNAT family N-acetyltransferase n=1 Tax=Oceanicola sp. D3 TaxID=2587163 RepID=UPI0011240C95|nr:GNAT family N-acetyltransferase [Oceanicola sp. D3]QDC10962.1 GNAT family N-acetyltransferase [Oceanicola sp. D3]
MPSAPTITTERLRLRPHRIEDFEPMAALFATDWARYMGGPICRKEMWYWLSSEVGSWTLLGHGSLAIELRESNAFIGQIGLTKPEQFPEPELGWCVWPEFEGKGYAFEAAQALLAWAWANLPAATVVSYIDPENDRSIALARRLGAAEDGQAARPDGETPEDTVVYRHPRPEHA